MRKAILEHKLATEAEIQDIIDAWHEWTKAEEAQMVMHSCVLVIRK